VVDLWTILIVVDVRSLIKLIIMWVLIQQKRPLDSCFLIFLMVNHAVKPRTYTPWIIKSTKVAV